MEIGESLKTEVVKRKCRKWKMSSRKIEQEAGRKRGKIKKRVWPGRKMRKMRRYLYGRSNWRK